MTVQRPSWVMNFKIKFDETLTVTPEPPPESVADRLENPTLPSSGATPQPLITQIGDENVSFILQRVPIQASMEKPGYRQAGKWSATFPFNDLPIDPRTVAAASVEIHIGVISDADFAKGMETRNQDGSLSSVLRTRTDAGTPNESTMHMLGIVDEWEVHHGSDSTVTINGRDMRGILLDTPVNASLPGAELQLLNELDLSQTIDQVVIQILSFNTFFDGFQVIVNSVDWPGGKIPAPAARDLIPRHRKGARGQKKGGRATPNSNSGTGNLNFWDLIVRFCYLVGAIPYFDGTGRLIIRPSATVYDKIRGPVDPVRNPTPFLAGRPRSLDSVTGVAISPPLKSRRLIYGRDIESLSFNRKFGGWRRPKTVRAIYLDPDSKEKGVGKVLVGVWPERDKIKARKTRSAPGKKGPMEEIVNVPVPGIKDVTRLTEIAKAIFNEMGRGQVGGAVTTTNLSSFGGSAADPDLLRLSPGDGVEFLIDVRQIRSGSPLISALTDHHRTSFDDQVSIVNKRIGNPNLARVLVATARGTVGELQRFFRVQNVKYDWDSDSGIKIAFDYENYIVARSQIGRASPAEGAASGSSTGKKQNRSILQSNRRTPA